MAGASSKYIPASLDDLLGDIQSLRDNVDDLIDDINSPLNENFTWAPNIHWTGEKNSYETLVVIPAPNSQDNYTLTGDIQLTANGSFKLVQT